MVDRGRSRQDPRAWMTDRGGCGGGRRQAARPSGVWPDPHGWEAGSSGAHGPTRMQAPASDGGDGMWIGSPGL